MSSRNVETFKAAHRAFNSRDFDAVVNAMAENVIYQDRARDATYRGRAGFKEFMQSWVASFSDAQVTEPTYTDAGDTVIAQFVGRGVNDGPLGPLTATGRPVKFNFCEILHFNDTGQVISGDAYYDQLSILAQLGHAPDPAKARGGLTLGDFEVHLSRYLYREPVCARLPLRETVAQVRPSNKFDAQIKLPGAQPALPRRRNRLLKRRADRTSARLRETNSRTTSCVLDRKRRSKHCSASGTRWLSCRPVQENQQFIRSPE